MLNRWYITHCSSPKHFPTFGYYKVCLTSWLSQLLFYQAIHCTRWHETFLSIPFITKTFLNTLYFSSNSMLSKLVAASNTFSTKYMYFRERIVFSCGLKAPGHLCLELCLNCFTLFHVNFCWSPQDKKVAQELKVLSTDLPQVWRHLKHCVSAETLSKSTITYRNKMK